MGRILLTIAGVQAGWAACVLGARAGRPWVGPLVVVALLAARAATARDPWPFVRTLAGAVVLGALFDGVLVAAGVLAFPSGSGSTWRLPAWMLALWANFVPALDALGWTRGRWFLAPAVGAVGGPLSYMAGARLGALVLGDTVLGDSVLGPTEGTALLAIAAEWAVALPMLMALSRRQRRGAGVDEAVDTAVDRTGTARGGRP